MRPESCPPRCSQATIASTDRVISLKQSAASSVVSSHLRHRHRSTSKPSMAELPENSLFNFVFLLLPNLDSLTACWQRLERRSSVRSLRLPPTPDTLSHPTLRSLIMIDSFQQRIYPIEQLPWSCAYALVDVLQLIVLISVLNCSLQSSARPTTSIIFPACLQLTSLRHSDHATARHIGPNVRRVLGSAWRVHRCTAYILYKASSSCLQLPPLSRD